MDQNINLSPAFLQTLAGVPDNELTMAIPAIVANPALLGQLEQSASILGVTYQTLVNQINLIIGECETTCNDCYNAVKTILGEYYNQSVDSLNGIYDVLKSEYINCINTQVSAVDLQLPKPCYKDSDIAALLNPGEYVEIDNCTIPQQQWNDSVVDFGKWFPPAIISYVIDATGKIVAGAKLNSDFSYTLWDGTTYSLGDIGYGQGILSLIGAKELYPNYAKLKIISTYVNCATGTIDWLGRQGSGEISSSCIPSRQTQIATDGQTVNQGVKGTVNQTVNQGIGYNPITSIANNNLVCPQPVTNVNVPPANIVVNVPPCPTPNVIINNKQVRENTYGGKDSVLQTSDLIAAYLQSQGYDDTFIKLFTDQLESEEYQFEDQLPGEGKFSLLKQVM